MKGFWFLGFRRSRKISSKGCVKGANSWITGAVRQMTCHVVLSPVIHQFAGFAQPGCTAGWVPFSRSTQDPSPVTFPSRESRRLCRWDTGTGLTIAGMSGRNDSSWARLSPGTFGIARRPRNKGQGSGDHSNVYVRSMEYPLSGDVSKGGGPMRRRTMTPSLPPYASW